MPRPTPPVRAALALLALLAVVGIGALSFLLSDRWEAAEAAALAELSAATTTLAATLDRPAPSTALARRLDGAAGAGFNLAVFDGQGRLVASSGPALEGLNPDLNGLNPALVSEDGGAAPTHASLGEEEYLLALATAPRGGYRVLALRPVDAVVAAHGAASRRLVLFSLLVWLTCAAALVGVAWYAGCRIAARMQALAERLATLDTEHLGDARALLDRAADGLGAFAIPFGALADALRDAHAETAEAKRHVNALLQINPHYVLLCTLDGHIVDANPAFYAMSGLPFEAVRGNRIEVLDEVMPVEPLLDLARRSARENASIGGIEYALINRDDARRPVQVSLRAVEVGGKEAVMIQATDVANQRTLERQVATFSDALDLMVDQRVAQLTAGNASMSQLLDEAGVIMVSFDEGGGTRRWSRAAERLTGRRLSQVPHLSAFTSVLGLSPEARTSFNAWFWEAPDGAVVLDVSAATGPPRRVLWRKATASGGGRTERRLLIGVEMRRGEAPFGDGVSGFAPSLATVELTPSI